MGIICYQVLVTSELCAMVIQWPFIDTFEAGLRTNRRQKKKSRFTFILFAWGGSWEREQNLLLLK